MIRRSRNIFRRGNASFEQRPNLLWIQSEGFELSAPFRGRVAEPLDTDAARQATFERGFDEVRCEERERDGHIDLTSERVNDFETPGVMRLVSKRV